MTADREAEVLVDVPHPLRVAPGEVGVDGDQVRAAAREARSGTAAWWRRASCLRPSPFRRSPEVQHDAADQLHVVGHHVPGHLVPGDHDVGAEQPAAASLTVAKASGRISSSTSAIISRSSLLLSGSILVETIFNWQGMGQLYFQAIGALDEAVIVALTFIFTLLYVVLRFLLDVLYMVLDPRVRYG